MPTRTTAETIEAVKTHPQRWALVTRESALSLPVPVGAAGSEALAFFWYPAGGPAMNRTAGAPTCRVLAGLGRPDDDITFLPVPPGDAALGAAPGTALGGTRIGGPIAVGEIDTLRAELYGGLDSLLGLGLGAPPPPGTELEAAARLRALYQRLAVIVLLPAQRALNPAFFAWLDAAAGPAAAE